MATKPMVRGGSVAKPAKISVRKISNEDLRIALRQGLDDFLTFRGDIVLAGLIYTVIGLAAVVMTTSKPLMPFFFPVVAGVGLLGPVAAVGFYELAKRREGWRPPEKRFERGYGQLFCMETTQAHEGCDFKFLHHGKPTPEPDIY